MSRELFDALAAPFPANQVHWRAQRVFERNGKITGMAVCYIDSRDVQDRLDAVCTPAGWRNSFEETAKGRVVCNLSILVNGEWITKADGAGDTDVEGEKGGLSDAFKRSAVMWGLGRYLYRIPVAYAECDATKKGDKLYFNKWTPAGIATLNKAAGVYVAPVAKPEPAADGEVIGDAEWAELVQLMEAKAVDTAAFCKFFQIPSLKELPVGRLDEARAMINRKKAA